MLRREAAETYAACFKSLADATRIQILTLLADRGRPMSVGAIVAAMEVGQSTVSHHLKILADAGFLLVEKRRTSSFFRINPACLSYFPTAAEVLMDRPASDPGAVAS